MRLFAFIFCLIFATGSLADDTILEGEDISAEEWRMLALGRTLTYRVGDQFFALERYAKTGNRVEIQLAGGECLSGTWQHVGNAFCYSWENQRPVCFRHLRTGDQIIVVQVENGALTDNVQNMTHVSEALLSCGQNLS